MYTKSKYTGVYLGRNAGNRFYLIRKYSTNCKNIYTDCKIEYRFAKKAKKQLLKVEERLLKCYFKTYGEVPPLNHNLPNPKPKKENWNNLNCEKIIDR